MWVERAQVELMPRYVEQARTAEQRSERLMRTIWAYDLMAVISFGTCRPASITRDLSAADTCANRDDKVFRRQILLTPYSRAQWKPRVQSHDLFVHADV